MNTGQNRGAQKDPSRKWQDLTSKILITRRTVPPRCSPTVEQPDQVEVTLLTGGIDKHYAYGLATALTADGVRVEFIGNGKLDGPEMHATPRLTFLNLGGQSGEGAPVPKKVSRLLLFYARLLRYSWVARPKVFHILWNNKLQYFDRTLLMCYYKLLGKKVVVTAHNVNAARRDSRDSALNRLSLKVQYRLTDHIFVHTSKMKREIIEEFGVSTNKVSVIPFGINNAVPNTDITCAEARLLLRLGSGDKVILFFGKIRPSKGLEYLVAAFRLLAARRPECRLIVAGQAMKGAEGYLRAIQEQINGSDLRTKVVQRIGFVPDSEIELYFKVADVVVLPYRDIFQSGVLFLGYSFGLPAIASDVGSFREDIAEGEAGFICPPGDSEALAATIEKYFASDLFKELETRRPEIREYVRRTHSWNAVSVITRNVYLGLVQAPPARGAISEPEA